MGEKEHHGLELGADGVTTVDEGAAVREVADGVELQRVCQHRLGGQPDVSMEGNIVSHSMSSAESLEVRHSIEEMYSRHGSGPSGSTFGSGRVRAVHLVRDRRAAPQAVMSNIHMK